MEWDHIIKSLEAASTLRNQLLKGPTQNALDEQLQLTRLLERYARNGLFEFPLCVKQTSSKRPDFQLLSGGRRISVEISKIASQNYEHAASLQRHGLRHVLMSGELLRPGQRRFTKEEVIQKAFIIPQMVEPLSLREIDQAWWEQFQKVVESKLMKLSADDFEHGEEDWLLLWDRFETEDWQMEPRLPTVRSWLSPIWTRSRRFNRIFIQADDFTWTASLSPNDCQLLR